MVIAINDPIKAYDALTFWYRESLLNLLVVYLTETAKKIVFLFEIRMIWLLGKELNLFKNFVVCEVQLNKVDRTWFNYRSDGIIIVVILLLALSFASSCNSTSY